MNFCPNCGNEVNDNSNFCSNCGSKLDKIEKRNWFSTFFENPAKSSEIQNNQNLEDKIVLPPGENCNWQFYNFNEIFFLYDRPEEFDEYDSKWIELDESHKIDNNDGGENCSLLSMYSHTTKEGKTQLYICSNIQIYANPKTSRMFQSDTLEKITFENFDTSEVSDMSEMFSECEKLESLDLSNFNISKIKDLTHMFRDCKNLKKIVFPNLDTDMDIKSDPYARPCLYLEFIFKDLPEIDFSDEFNWEFDFFDEPPSYEILDYAAHGYGLDYRCLYMGISMFEGCTELTSINFPDYKNPGENIEITVKKDGSNKNRKKKGLASGLDWLAGEI